MASKTDEPQTFVMVNPTAVPLGTVLVKVLAPGEPVEQSKPMTRMHRLPAPLCCVTKGSHTTLVGTGELMVRKDITYCKLPIKYGAGYDVARVPLDHVSKYTLSATKFLCSPAKQDMAVTLRPTGEHVSADLGPEPDDAEFLGNMAKHVPVSTGRAPGTFPDAKPAASFTLKTKCGLNTKTMTLSANGFVTVEEKQAGCTSLRHVDAALLADLAYVRYTTAGLLSQLFLGGANRIEVSFMGDKYFVDLRMPADQLPAAHDAVLACTLGRAPSAPLHTYTGANGRTEMAVGPEFTTVRMTKPSLCSLLATSEVTTVKTSDISHLRAALPSWQNALIKAIRDIELVKLSRALTALSGEDLVTLPVWPCNFFNDAYLTIILTVKALVSIFQFIMIFFFRKTSLILGGPGPAKQVAFLPDEHPEKLLRDVASHVQAGQKMFSWANPSAGFVNVPLNMPQGSAKAQPAPLSASPNSAEAV